MGHVIAIVGLAVLCGIWVVVMRASGDTINSHRCGVCGHQDGDPNSAPCHGSDNPNCRSAADHPLPEGKAERV